MRSAGCNAIARPVFGMTEIIPIAATLSSYLWDTTLGSEAPPPLSAYNVPSTKGAFHETRSQPVSNPVCAQPAFLLRLPFGLGERGHTRQVLRLAHRGDRWRQAALHDGWSRPCADPAAWLRGDLAHVDTHPPSARREIYGDRPGPAWHRGLGDPRERPGHEDCCDPHSWARPLARSPESQGGRARHRPHGRLCLRRAVPRGSGETGCDGRISPRRG